MEYKSELIRSRLARPQLPDGASAESRRIAQPEVRSRRLNYRLDCGRDVYVEECRISRSTLGSYAGSGDAIRAEVIRRLPDRAFEQFPSSDSVFVKPVPEGNLPAYTFMVSLVCRQPVSDPAADFSSLVVCWLSDDIETSLPELVEREVRAVKWDMHAVDGDF
ncbi:MAG TPA: hypothetical protein VJX47_04830 [Candidatus Sulfotelmatobacter sp.]|nr:hypothetical protein [Candidatus Sulfotelmatobacter sp.]